MSVPDRARGALMGLALGHALGLGRTGPVEPVDGPFPRGDTPDSPHADPVARSLLLAEELLEDEVDLERVATRWVAWWRADGRGVSPRSAEALDHLARWHAPLRQAPDPGGSAPLVICLPVALATWDRPRQLVTGTYHTALLADPDPCAAWAAVAVNVALAQFLAGRRDFVADVIEVLLANDAGPEVLSVARRVPILRSEDLDCEAAEGHPLPALEVALWAGYHFTSWERGMGWVATSGPVAGIAGGLVGAVLGAREGEHAIPARWADAIPDPGRVRGLAKRLVTARERGAAASG